jgi:hypothetical protein
MARKVINIIYNLVRKRLAIFNTKASGSGITRIPTDRQIKKNMEDVFQTLKDGGYNVLSAEKVIQNEDDLARVLTNIQQNKIADIKRRKDASQGIETVLDKMNRGIPLNPGDQAKIEGAGMKTKLDAFRGFEPKVIQGGKKDLGDKLKDFDGDPDAMAGGGLAGALAKLKKKFGKDIIQKGKAPKKSKKKKHKICLESLIEKIKQAVV